MKTDAARRVPLRRRARFAAQRLGVDVHRYIAYHDADVRRVWFLRQCGIEAVVDGGANVGKWAQQLRLRGYGGLIVAFEPLAAAYSALAAAAAPDPLWICVRAALGDADGTAEINVAGNSVSSSLLPMEAAHLRAARESAYQGTETVRLVRLDSVLPDLVPAGVRLGLKLDVQGYEAIAIEGAAGVLEDVMYIESELSTVPLYRGQMLYRDFVCLLADRGFDLVSMQEGLIDRATGRALQLDAMFMRPGAGGVLRSL